MLLPYHHIGSSITSLIYAHNFKQILQSYQDFYIKPYNWNLLHLLAIYKPHEISAVLPSHSDFKVSFLVDTYGNTPLHYLITQETISYDSINVIFAYIVDYLSDSKTHHEWHNVTKALGNLFPYIIAKISPSLVIGYLEILFSEPDTIYNEELPKFGKSDNKKFALREDPILHPEHITDLYQDGKDQIIFRTMNVPFDYDPRSTDMFNLVVTLSTSIKNQKLLGSYAIQNLIDKFWHSTRYAMWAMCALFSLLMTLYSIYIGLGDRITAFEIIILLISLLILILEIPQMKILKLDYIKNFWNMLDLVNLSLIIATMIVRLSDSHNELLRSWLYSTTLTLGYFRWISYLRLFKATSKLV